MIEAAIVISVVSIVLNVGMAWGVIPSGVLLPWLRRRRNK